MKTHFKKLANPEYLGSYDFEQGEERTLTIVSVTSKEVTGAGNKKNMRPVLNFDKGKPMVCNSTNAKTISKLCKSPYVEDWVGLAITIYVLPNVDAFGEKVDALRVRPVAPGKPALTESMPQFNEAVKYIAGGGDIANIKAKYTLSNDVEQLLTNQKAKQ
jgi:hypothetical protein